MRLLIPRIGGYRRKTRIVAIQMMITNRHDKVTPEIDPPKLNCGLVGGDYEAVGSADEAVQYRFAPPEFGSELFQLLAR